MLEIQEVSGTAGYEEIIARAGNADIHITEALDRGEAIGFIAYAYGEEQTTVYAYDDGGDLMLCDGLVRSVMFKSALKGIECIEFALADEKAYGQLRRLRFLPEDSTVCKDVSSFMNGCESCKHNS